MTTKRQVQALAQYLDVEITENSNHLWYQATFYTNNENVEFASSSACVLNVSWANDGNKSAFWQECAEELQGGLL